MTTMLALLAAAAIHVPPCAMGSWTSAAGGTPIFAMTVSDTPAGPTVTWTRPQHFEFDGDTFSAVTGPPITRTARQVRMVESDLETSFDDPMPGGTPDVFHIHCAGPGRLAVGFATFPSQIEPFAFVKSNRQTVRGGWDHTRAYTRQIDRPTNLEMTQIFTADQADREGNTIDWSVVSPADEKRRQRTQLLLDAGMLRSGEDFYHAAFVFQHGSTPDDYLKAHILALVAIARGDPGAVWIASATLDRYLQAVGKPQILGTQFNVPKGGPATQEPYDRQLISDALRAALHVPRQSEQEKQREAYTAAASATNKR